MRIEILGTGVMVSNLFSNALEALRESGIKGTVVVVKDLRRIMKYGALATPALAIKGMVMLSGRVASPDEIVALLQRHLSDFV